VRKSILAAILMVLAGGAAQAARLKELVEVEGFRGNDLVGFGVVVGLAGTGDDATSVPTRRALAAMMKRLGITVDPADVKAKNVAVVTVTAKLPPFARPGMKLDVTVSSVGSAKSLQGGTLVVTPLKGADLQTYALAQGPLSLGGFAAGGATGSASVKNHNTVGLVPGGGTVEREAPGAVPQREIVLLLRQPDFTTASRIAAAVDKSLGEGSAKVRDPAAITVTVGKDWKGRAVELVAALEALEATPDAPARVVIDERTGTVVVGAGVTIGPAAIAHGDLTVNVAETPVAVQPAPLSKGGKTTVVPQTQVEVNEAKGDLHVIAGAATVSDVAAALNALGVKPRDLVPIFQALRAAGALNAEIEVI
jgi:flagellar P-ring protein FlgI